MLSCSGPGLVSNAHTKLVDICSPDQADAAGQPHLDSAQSPARLICWHVQRREPVMHSPSTEAQTCNAFTLHVKLAFLALAH